MTLSRFVLGMMVAATAFFGATPALCEDGMVVELEGGKRYQIYVVQKGDAVWKIAERELGDSGRWRDILVPEKFVSTRPDLIHPGQMLFIPARPKAGGGEGDGGSEQKRTAAVSGLAVGRFVQREENGRYAWLGVGLAEAMTADFSKERGVQTIARDQVERAAAGAWAASGGDALRPARDAAGKVGAGHVVTGSYAVAAEAVELEALLVNTASGAVVERARVSGKLHRSEELARLAALRLAGAAGISGDSQAEIMTGPRTSFAAFELTSKGKAFLYEGKQAEARNLFRKALEADPSYAAAKEDLKASFSAADTLAVAAFKNASASREHDWLGHGIAEALTTDVKKLTNVYMVERLQIDKALEELKLGSLGGIVDERTAPKLGKLVGASVMIIGSYQVLNGQIRIDMRMVDASSGQIVLTESAGGEVSRLFSVEAALAERVAQALHVNPTADQKEKLMAGKPDIEAFKRQILASTRFEVVKQEKDKDPAKIRTLALLNFQNASGAADLDWLRTGIPGTLTADLKAKAKVTLVDRTTIDQALEELKIASLGMVPADKAPQLGRIMGADAIVTGTYQAIGDTLRIDSKIVRVETGEVLAGGQVNGPAANIFGLQKKLADEVLVALGLQKPKQERSAGADGDGKVDEKESILLAKRAYKFELAPGNKERIKQYLDRQQERDNERVILRMNDWLPTIRSSAPSAAEGHLLLDGEMVPYGGFLFSREHVNRIQLLKDERDLCIEIWDGKAGAK